MQSQSFLRLVVGTLVTLALGISAFANVRVHEDVIYVSHDGVDVSYDVIKAESPNGAAVILMASGGWNSRKLEVEQQEAFFDFLLNAGYTIITVRHRSAPTFKVPQAVEDVQYAIRHIRHHAETYGIDPSRMASYGFSSGGHLSLMIALDSDTGEEVTDDPIASTSSHVAAAVAFFPPVDLAGMTGPNIRYPALDFDADLAASVSPIQFVDQADPPVLLVHGTKDQVVPISNSRKMLDSLTKVGVEADLIILDGAGHGGFTEDQEASSKSDILAFLAKHLGAS